MCVLSLSSSRFSGLGEVDELVVRLALTLKCRPSGKAAVTDITIPNLGKAGRLKFFLRATHHELSDKRYCILISALKTYATVMVA